MRAIALAASDAPPALVDDLPDRQPRPTLSCVCARPRSTRSTTRSRRGCSGAWSTTTFRSSSAATTPAPSSNRRGRRGLCGGRRGLRLPPARKPAVHEGSWAELIASPPGCRSRRTRLARPRRGRRRATRGHRRNRRVDALALSEGETILIVGATGGVGSFAVQLAARAGATIIAPALPEDADYLRELGSPSSSTATATSPPPSATRHPDGVDALLDLVSYAPGVFDGAVKAAPASPRRTAQPAKGRAHQRDGGADPDNLRRLAALLDDGTLQVHSRRRSTSPTRPTRSRRSAPPTPEVSSPSASNDLTRLAPTRWLAQDVVCCVSPAAGEFD